MPHREGAPVVREDDRMRSLWKTALALVLGAAAAGGRAGAQWPSAPPDAADAAGRRATPAATLDRPVPLDGDAAGAPAARPVVDPALRPVLFRAQAADPA